MGTGEEEDEIWVKRMGKAERAERGESVNSEIKEMATDTEESIERCKEEKDE